MHAPAVSPPVKKPPRYPLNRTIGGHQSRSFPGLPVRSLVTTPISDTQESQHPGIISIFSKNMHVHSDKNCDIYEKRA
jgi:hypothetical protein